MADYGSKLLYLVTISHAILCALTVAFSGYDRRFKFTTAFRTSLMCSRECVRYAVGKLCSSVVNWIIMLSNREYISVVFPDFVRDSRFL